MDCKGNTADKSFELTVDPEPLPELVNKSKLSAASIYKGKIVRIKTDAEGGDGAYAYSMFYKLTTKNSWNSFTGTALRLGTVGAFDIKVIVSDGAGNISEKRFTVKVREVPAELTNVSVISDKAISSGSTITVTADAAGGAAPYTYAYFYKLADKNSYNSFSDGFINSASRSLRLRAAGVYDIRVIVMDSAGARSAKDFKVIVS